MPAGRRYESGPDATIRATDEALARAADARAVVLVEGVSDQIAVEVLADRLGRDLEADGVVVVPIGGAHAVRKTLADFADRPTVRLSGLVDWAEAELFVAAAADSAALTPDRIHACDADLEEELIRAMEPTELEALLAPAAGPRGRVLDAMRYASLGGGKRLRPFLVLESARMFEVPRPQVAGDA